MAKRVKAKAKGAKAKKAKAKKVQVKKVKIMPTYMTGEGPLKIGLHDVIKALAVIDNHGHMKKFSKAAKKQNAGMLVPVDTVNFVKDFVAKYGMHEDRIGKVIINARKELQEGTRGLATASAHSAPEKDPFECDFSRH